MDYGSVTINLKSENNDLSWYTLYQSVVEEGRIRRQSCCPGMFAIVTLKIEPHTERDTGKRIAVFENQITEIDYGRGKNPIDGADLQTICHGVISGIEVACLDLKTKNYAIARIKVTALSAIFHPIDSSKIAFERATISALTKAFNEVELIKI